MFNTALYYPTIDITNEYWLKSAILFWNRIETIVPQDIRNPYKRRTTQILEKEGFLFPHRVNPFHWEVAGLHEDLVRYCDSIPGREGLTKKRVRTDSRISVWDGLSYNRGLDKYGDFFLHVGKIPHMDRVLFDGLVNADGFVEVNERFMKYYMTLLANRICQMNNMALLTDRVHMNNLSNDTRCEGLSRPFEENEEEQRLGLMYKIVLEDIRLDPSTPIERIIRFKRNRADELERFRQEMGRLTAFESDGMSISDIENEVRTIYTNSVKPAVLDLKKTLGDARFNWITSSVGYIMTGIIPLVLEIPSAQSIISSAAGGVIGMTVASTQYKKTLNREEERSPYTYLLKMGNYFRR